MFFFRGAYDGPSFLLLVLSLSPKKKKVKEGGTAPANGGDCEGMDGAKPLAAAAGGKQELEEALLQIVHQHHRQFLRQRQQTGTPPAAIAVSSAALPK